LAQANLDVAVARARLWQSYLPKQLGIRAWMAKWSPKWLPGAVSSVLSSVFSLAFRLLLIFLVCSLFYLLLRVFKRYRRKRQWSDLKEGVIMWSVSSIADDTKQLAAGALMDALNLFHNPLFQRLPTSSLLALPPGLSETNQTTTGKNVVPDGESSHASEGGSDPPVLVWRDFLIPSVDDSFSTTQVGDTQPGVRAYLSREIETIDLDKFNRHIFQQVEAFDDLTLKLGVVETSLSAVVRLWKGWWTEGWPTVRGAVVIETVGDESYASIRLVANFDKIPGKKTTRPKPAPDDRDISPEELFATQSTISVYASTKIDAYSDAVALASQRAAFRLLYRLAKRPAEPNMAIAASSYRQGVRLLLFSL
jgi:hypothetical protein